MKLHSYCSCIIPQIVINKGINNHLKIIQLTISKTIIWKKAKIFSPTSNSSCLNISQERKMEILKLYI